MTEKGTLIQYYDKGLRTGHIDSLVEEKGRAFVWVRPIGPKGKNRGAGGRKRRLRVLKKTEGRCWYCGAEAQEADHLFPLNPRGYRGQTFNEWRGNGTWNLIPACVECNRKKDNFPPEIFRERFPKKFWGGWFWGELHSPPGPEAFIRMPYECRSTPSVASRSRLPIYELHAGDLTAGCVASNNPQSQEVSAPQTVRCHSLLWKLWNAARFTFGFGFR
jgi:5-methylcytosine-specific restriction endonuclease McrA